MSCQSCTGCGPKFEVKLKSCSCPSCKPDPYGRDRVYPKEGGRKRFSAKKYLCESCASTRFPGILYPAGENGRQVMRCDTCELFSGDDAAALFLSQALGVKVREIDEGHDEKGEWRGRRYELTVDDPRATSREMERR